MKKTHIFLCIICLLGTIFHMSLLHLNEVLKVADSFAYLQMASFLADFSQEGLGNGWFGFVYSLPIALMNIFIDDNFIAAKIVNIILLNISALLLWRISTRILSPTFALCAAGLFFLSPTFLHFNIHILSENIYIPLFLALFLTTVKFIENIIIWGTDLHSLQKETFTLACLLWLMYLTRAEAFIYLWSIGIIAITLLAQKHLSLKKFLWLGSIFLLTFFVFISPYLFHLHSLTWEWWLTNKWASNLRQAELRGVERMDDAGFEQAVAELSPDKHQLIAGFAGGMVYDAPQIEWSLWSFISKNPSWFIQRVWQNQKKLFTRNLPEIFLWKSPKLYDDRSQVLFYQNKVFLFLCILPLLTLIYGLFKALQKQRKFFYTGLSFFIPALIFFTLFFTLNRYFLIFLPLMLVFFCYGLQNISKDRSRVFQLIPLILFINILWAYGLSLKVYYSIESPKDQYYSLKQEAGEWLRGNFSGEEDPRIMERFPIVTYYSWADYRWITPYTNDIWDIVEYAQYNDLDILVVDTMDFETYRPKLRKYLTQTPDGFTKLKEFTNSENHKVILYALKK